MKKKQIYEVWYDHTLFKTFRIMRLTLGLLLVLVVQGWATKSYSQKTVFNLNMKNAQLVEILDAIENQSDYYFLFNYEQIRTDKKFDVQATNKSIDETLDLILKGTYLTYTIKDRQIIISKEQSVMQQNTASTSVQQKSISGKVTDNTGASLPGVSVIVKGTTKGVITDTEGKYLLAGIQSGATLVFSFIGMKQQEIVVGGQTIINISMKENVLGIDEVVVVGYGTQKKVNLTGSVAVAPKEILENKSVPNSIAALQGNLPGVAITRTSGKPGSEGYNLQIRGATSVNNSSALVLVDGAYGSLDELNPNDIESISVLKDAAAASIYGSNAAGGVVLVTTKRGKSGKTVFEYSGVYGITNPDRMPHRLDSFTEMSMFAEAYTNAGLTTTWQDPIRLSWLKGENLDVPDATGKCPSMFFPGEQYMIDPSRPNVMRSFTNQNKIKEVLKGNNPTQSHNLSIKGGNDKNSFFFSTGYYNRRGILRYGPDSNDRFNTRLNISNQMTRHIILNTSLAFTNSNIYEPAISTDEILFIAFKRWGSDATYDHYGNYLPGNGMWTNGVAEEKEGGTNTTNSYVFDGKTNLKIKDLLPGLEFDVIASKRYIYSKNIFNQRTLTYMGPLGTPTFIAHNPNTMSKSADFSDHTNLQAYATYNYSISESHNFTLLGGYSHEDYRQEIIYAGASNLVTNDFFSLGWGDPNTKTNGDEIYTSATMAFFGRLNYNFLEKYLFEANLRYDGSSKLAPNDRWKTFPSLSVGWAIGKEKFFQGIHIIDDLKLRASWGQLGNSNALGNYDYIGMLNASTDLPFNNTPTNYFYQSVLASKKKSWEIIESSNVGIDFSVFNRKLSFTGDVYVKKNKNMLASLQAPSIIGVGLPSFNVGELRTSGWELNLTWKDKIKEFNYWVNVNLSDNTNKLTRYEGVNIVRAGLVSRIEGMPLNTIWGYKTDGMFQTDQEYTDYGVFINPLSGKGDLKYLDLNHDKKISVGEGTLADHGDLIKLGDTNPRYLFGINLGFRLKGIDFSCFLQGVGKRIFMLESKSLQPLVSASYMPWREQLDYWTPDNPDAFWPRLDVSDRSSYLPSDHWVQNAAYIRLKNIELGYTIPQILTQRVHIDKARFFVSGQDLWEATKVFSFIDPEYPNNSELVYPFYRTMSVGLNITF